jgi:hypothetical protein
MVQATGTTSRSGIGINPSEASLFRALHTVAERNEAAHEEAIIAHAIAEHEMRRP